MLKNSSLFKTLAFLLALLLWAQLPIYAHAVELRSFSEADESLSLEWQVGSFGEFMDAGTFVQYAWLDATAWLYGLMELVNAGLLAGLSWGTVKLGARLARFRRAQS